MIRSILRRGVALFVDDARLAASVIVWLLLAAAWARLLHGALAGVVLFAGLAAILLESTMRAARR